MALDTTIDRRCEAGVGALISMTCHRQGTQTSGTRPTPPWEPLSTTVTEKFVYVCSASDGRQTANRSCFPFQFGIMTDTCDRLRDFKGHTSREAAVGRCWVKRASTLCSPQSPKFVGRGLLNRFSSGVSNVEHRGSSRMLDECEGIGSSVTFLTGAPARRRQILRWPLKRRIPLVATAQIAARVEGE